MIRVSLTPPIVGAADWVSRTRTARDLLCAKGYKRGDFVTVDHDLRQDGIALYWHPAYPQHWRDRYLFSRRRTHFLDERAIPVGLVLYWPDGVDFMSEAYDAQDPIFILDDLNFWENLTDDEFRDMIGAH